MFNEAQDMHRILPTIVTLVKIILFSTLVVFYVAYINFAESLNYLFYDLFICLLRCTCDRLHIRVPIVII